MTNEGLFMSAWFRSFRSIEIAIGCALLSQLQWLFGNIYEEILSPNSIAASVQALDAYNAFFWYTEPYHYYVPFTQLGCFLLCILAIHRSVPACVKDPLRRASVFGLVALALTAFIVIHYNLKMFFGTVDHLGASVHRLYFEWAAWNGVRIVLVALEVRFCIRAYRTMVQLGSSSSGETTQGTDNVAV